MTIRTEQLTKIYRTSAVETTALQGIDLEIGTGEFVAVMGPSGCGKTTLLNLLGLLDAPSGGRLFFLGQDTASLSESHRTRLRKGNIGFVFQAYNLLEDLNVRENVALPLRYMRLPAAERDERTAEALERVGIAHRQDHYPSEMSGGQQQRVAVARAIVTRPKLILADEPTGNLDSKNSEQILDLLGELNQDGAAIVMVTHSPEHARHSQRVIRLFDGQIADETTPVAAIAAGR